LLRLDGSLYLLWQQLSVQPPLQQVCPHCPLQQSLQQAPFGERGEVCASAVKVRTMASDANAIMRFISILLDTNVGVEMRGTALAFREAASRSTPSEN
jgi:hypothetical protein